ncbi:LANO_0C05314g1_1 [Lachancea nothofagi CBS 11611]|uniref:LANO_0C05314g1_1 n=1 Tax=Lachancea nothofagi CBS 11611 TaxID=1266666 RepID=A0A1G4J7D0_9SACH|nr:LANO_0C05314g1_1 [Lachancea nothofagi CBS 11611]
MNVPYASSRDDVSVNSFGSSVWEKESRAGLDPRARSTSDLFEVPSHRIRPKPYKRSSLPTTVHYIQANQGSQDSLSLIPEQQEVPPHLLRSLTPYQKQRRRMMNSFQFPNGESFTPKQKPLKSFSSQNETHAQIRPGRGLPKSASCSNFNNVVDRRDSLGPPRTLTASTRAGSLTNVSNLKTHLPPVNRIHNSGRLSKVPTMGPLAKTKSANFSQVAAKNESSASFQASPTHLTSDLHNNTSSRTQAVSSNTSSTNSSNSLKSDNVVSSNTSTDASETPAKPLAPVNNSLLSTSYPHIPKTSSNLQISSAPRRDSNVVKPSPVQPKQPLQTPRAQAPKPSGSDAFSNPKGVKRSTSSRIGSFFKRFLPSKRKREASHSIQAQPVPTKRASNSPSLAKVTETPKISISRPSHSSSQEDQSTVLNEDSSKGHCMNDLDDGECEVDDDDDDDDQLLDIDLVFDSLLLKNDHPVSRTLNLNRAEREVLVPEDDPVIKADEEKSGTTEENMIDLEFIQEFSRLGRFISDGLGKDQPDFSVVPPPRSLKRPLLANKESMAGFYRQHASQNPMGVTPDQRLDHSLQQDWEFVHYDAVVSISSPREHSAAKKLRFGHAVYVKDTHAAGDYERSDKKFIRARRRMMQTKNMAFIDAVKNQLNEFKRGEMKVHGDSLQNTHYFL